MAGRVLDEHEVDEEKLVEMVKQLIAPEGGISIMEKDNFTPRVRRILDASSSQYPFTYPMPLSRCERGSSQYPFTYPMPLSHSIKRLKYSALYCHLSSRPRLLRNYRKYWAGIRTDYSKRKKT